MLVLFRRAHGRVARPPRDHLWRPPATACLKYAAALRYQLLPGWLQHLHAVQLVNYVPPIPLCGYLYQRLLLHPLSLIDGHLAHRRLHRLNTTAHVRWVHDLVIVGHIATSLLERPALARLAPILLEEGVVVFGGRGGHGGGLELPELEGGRVVIVGGQPLLLGGLVGGVQVECRLLGICAGL